jgi:predicted transcriptional regulator
MKIMPELLLLESSENNDTNSEGFKIIQRMFNLTQKEGELFQFLYLNAKEGICITHLVQNLNSERSILQKLLTQLVRKELITRKQVSLGEYHDRCMQKHEVPLMENKKGYLYLYFPLHGAELLNRVQFLLNLWSQHIASMVAK